jgi:hypothetical protein
MGALLREALHSPRDLLLIVAAVLVATVVTSPLPAWLWGPAALLLAAVPGTVVMHRVRRRAESRAGPFSGGAGARPPRTPPGPGRPER